MRHSGEKSTRRGRVGTRDVLRERWKARVPRWYSPVVHLGLNLTLSVGIIAWLAHGLFDQGVRPLAWLAIPCAFMAANVLEWIVHRFPMHRRTRLLDGLFRRHTLQHHRYFTEEHMEISSTRELFFVTFPVQFGLLSALTVLLVFAVLRFIAAYDVAALSAITLIGYFLALEWFHLAFHLPLAWFEHGPFRGRLLNRLREHHRIHHDPHDMNRVNFNITLPLTDWILGTMYDPSVAAAPSLEFATEAASESTRAGNP